MLFLLASIIIILLAVNLNYKIKNFRNATAPSMRFSSLPAHYIYCFLLWSIIFAAIISLSSFVATAKYLLLAVFLTANFFLVKYLFNKNFQAKKHIESAATLVMSVTAGIGILITIAITVSILFEALKFFEQVNVFDFLFGLKWNPQMAIHAEQSVSESSFGMVPVLLGTLLITLIAVAISVPLGIMAATYLVFYAKPKFRDYCKPVLEILAGVPTVVYGYFAVIVVAPFFKNSFASFGVEIASESALAAGFVMGVMIIPFVLSLTDDALNSVPQYLKDGALALGSTKSEMVRKVVLGAAMPSIVGAVILAVSRAIGETMIVTMAAGLVANLSFNPLDSVTTATAQIVTLLVGDQEFNSPKTLAAFALAMVLFVLTLLFNAVALIVMKRYSRQS